eukprot:7390783-Prymnesium_polylepis.1
MASPRPAVPPGFGRVSSVRQVCPGKSHHAHGPAEATQISRLRLLETERYVSRERGATRPCQPRAATDTRARHRVGVGFSEGPELLVLPSY